MWHTCILRVVRKVSEQVEMAAVTEERPKLVRRRTWTKEEAEEALKRQEEMRVSRAAEAEWVMTLFCSWKPRSFKELAKSPMWNTRLETDMTSTGRRTISNWASRWVAYF